MNSLKCKNIKTNSHKNVHSHYDEAYNKVATRARSIGLTFSKVMVPYYGFFETFGNRFAELDPSDVDRIRKSYNGYLKIVEYSIHKNSEKIAMCRVIESDAVKYNGMSAAIKALEYLYDQLSTYQENMSRTIKAEPEFDLFSIDSLFSDSEQEEDLIGSDLDPLGIT
jgi:hypothetical protein